MSDLTTKIYNEKCPSCGEGEVFFSKGNVFLFKSPKMRKNCPQCGKVFEKEPGYFTGAMYVSYALCIAEMVAIFLLFKLTPFSLDYLAYFLILIVVLLWPFNFRMSRIIWMYIT